MWQNDCFKQIDLRKKSSGIDGEVRVFVGSVKRDMSQKVSLF